MKIDTSSVGVSGSRRLELAKPTQLHAPGQMVEQFHALLVGVQQGLRSGKSTLTPMEAKHPALEGDLLSETAVTVRKAEVSTEALEREIRKSADHSNTGEDLNTQKIKSINYQQTVSSLTFVGIRLIANKAEDLAEEVSSLTKGR